MLVQRIRKYLRLIRICWLIIKYRLDSIIVSEKKLFIPLKIFSFLCFWRWFDNYTHLGRGTRIKMMLEELGPVYIKLGQMLATRSDILPDDITSELTTLLDNVAPFPPEQFKKILQSAYPNKDINTIFSEIDYNPLASASMAQVHGARLIDGKNVVIKILRPNIEKAVEQDIEVILMLANMFIKYWPASKNLKPIEIILEIRKSLFAEIDLRKEAANAIHLKRNFKNNPNLYIPQVYIDLTKKNILVQERVYGIPVNNIDELNRKGVNLSLLARKGVEIFFTQVFKDRFFHADMHPGNIFVDVENPKNPNFIVVDFGIVGTLSKYDQRYLAENFIAFFNRDYQKVAELHVQSGWLNKDTSTTDFANSIMMICEPIFEKPLKDISFSETLFSLFEVAREYNINIQPQLILLQKTLIYVEGLGRKLDPNLDLWITAKPFLETWMKEQLSIKTLIKNIYSEMPYWLEKLPDVPNALYYNLINSNNKSQKLCLNIENIDKIKSGSFWQNAMQIVTTVAVTIIAIKLIFLS